MDNRFKGKQVNIIVYNNHRLSAEVILNPYRESRNETHEEMYNKKRRLTVEEKSFNEINIRLYKGASTLSVHARVGLCEIGGSINYFDGTDIILYLSKHRGNNITYVPDHDSKLARFISRKLGIELTDEMAIYNVPLSNRIGSCNPSSKAMEEESTSEDEIIDPNAPDDGSTEVESSSVSVSRTIILSILIFFIALIIVAVVYFTYVAIMRFT